ncbi:uncharacterized protein LOC106178477 [Lingula anatina]|uniref:Uncharacterized protein LOC106178477 n=1 Tax=Lingula anatina TaxID=7574 RepID=A0A1S3K3B8_LINAN|nr:uncharacterized protein LOC106178477 [Lingula anatina]|eukprot:XP_013417123.1 uncharacterized protein LOC106178477 [Lingula anatina]
MPTLHPVNMRHFCKPPLEPQHLGYMVLTVDTTLKVPKRGTFWGFARKNSQRIHSALVSNDHMTLLRIGDKVWNRDDYLRKVADSQKDGGRNPNYFTLSNIGNLDKILNTCFVNLEVEDVLTSTGIHAEGPLFLHNVLTFKNQLRWHLNYAANVIHRQQALDHAARIEKILVEAVRGPDTQKQNANQQQVTHLFQSNGIAQQKIRERNMPQQSSRYSSVNSEVLDSKGHWVEKQDRRLPRINVVPCPSNRIQYWPYTELPHTKINQNSVTHANMSSTQGYAHGKIPWSSKDLAFVRPYKVLPSYRQPSKAGVYNINQISPLTSAWSSYACGPVPHFLPRRRAPENLKFFW